MSYIDGVVVAVPTDKKDEYLAYARLTAAIFHDAGATSVVDTWGHDVPHGKVTDFYRAVAAEDGETVCLGWIVWPDRAARDAGWARLESDPRMADLKPPFDGKRMIFGAFGVLNEG